MGNNTLPEVWQRGLIADLPALLQPAAHALLQAQEEIHEMLTGFPDGLLWDKPASVASVAFHLQHIAGVLDRLFTYAAENTLSDEQLMYLAQEGKPHEGITVAVLLKELDKQIVKAVSHLKATDEATLTDVRYVGRKRVPSTVTGLLFHAAEHTMRHTGQLLVTVQVIMAGKGA